MKLMLAQNIRTQRKAHSLTQENLAEAIGVTVGAVSKWENGTTSPDLVTLMGLADLFGTSVDALLGYQLGGHTVQSTVEELHTLQQKKEYQAGTAKAENALQRQAKALALQYDATPDYKITHVPYCEKSNFTSAADDFGASTLDGITAQIDANRVETPVLAQWWQEVCNEDNSL